MEQRCRKQRVRIEGIVEYILEYLCGRPAIVWFRTEAAYYKVTCFKREYAKQLRSVQDAANIAGHVINTLLELSCTTKDTSMIVKKVAKLAKMTIEATIDAVLLHREFILQEIKKQSIYKLNRFGILKDMSSVETWALTMKRVREDLANVPTAISIQSSSTEKIRHDSKDNVNVAKDQPAELTLSISSTGSNCMQTIAPNPTLCPEKSSRNIVEQKFILDVATSCTGRRTRCKSLLPLRIQQLSLPSIQDDAFMCPICGISIFRVGRISVVQKLLNHIEAMHSDLKGGPYPSMSGAKQEDSGFDTTLLFDWPNRNIVKVVEERDSLYESNHMLPCAINLVPYKDLGDDKLLYSETKSKLEKGEKLPVTKVEEFEEPPAKKVGKGEKLPATRVEKCGEFPVAKVKECERLPVTKVEKSFCLDTRRKSRKRVKTSADSDCCENQVSENQTILKVFDGDAKVETLNDGINKSQDAPCNSPRLEVLVGAQIINDIHAQSNFELQIEEFLSGAAGFGDLVSVQRSVFDVERGSQSRLREEKLPMDTVENSPGPKNFAPAAAWRSGANEMSIARLISGQKESP